MLSSFPRDVVSRNSGRIRVWLAIVLDQKGKNFHRVRTDDELVMVCANVLGYSSRVMQFAEILFFKTNRESLDRLLARLAH